MEDFINNITDFYNENLTWLSDEWALKIIYVLLILLGLYIVKKFGKRVITKIVRSAVSPDDYMSPQAEAKRENTIITVFDAILKTALWIFGSMLILAQLGVNIAPLIAGASIAGIAIGFGAQKIVQDFVTGILIILENQYRIGDVIEIAGVVGIVEAITIRQTIIRDYEGKKHFISNGQISSSTNYTIDYAKLILNMDISYDEDIAKVKKVINEVGDKLAKDDDYKKHIMQPPQFLRVQDFGANSVVVRIAGKVDPGSQWRIAGELRLRLKFAFDKNNIEIPYNQLVIHKASK